MKAGQLKPKPVSVWEPVAQGKAGKQSPPGVTDGLWQESVKPGAGWKREWFPFRP